MDFAQQKMRISFPTTQASVWAAARMLALHTSTGPIWRLRQYLHQTRSAPGGVQGRAALRAGAINSAPPLAAFFASFLGGIRKEVPGRGWGALIAVSALYRNILPKPHSKMFN